jgi:putative two-component system response regulator
LTAVADVYDALRSRRPYKPALPHTQSVEAMLPAFGGHFDPALLPAFRRCDAEFENIYACCQEGA